MRQAQRELETYEHAKILAGNIGNDCMQRDIQKALVRLQKDDAALDLRTAFSNYDAREPGLSTVGIREEVIGRSQLPPVPGALLVLKRGKHAYSNKNKNEARKRRRDQLLVNYNREEYNI
jgi:hypothetical protein